MTVADNTSRNQYTATSGQTVFAYTFEIVDKSHIVVLKNGVALSEGTNYTVSNVGNDSGGNITLTVGATTGDIMTFYRDMPYSRTQNYINSGDFLASEVNSDFDDLWLAGEQTDRSFSQSIRKPITDSESISMELPEAATRKNSFLAFDATGAVDIVAAGDPSAPSSMIRQQFTGNGSTTAFTFSSAPGALGQSVQIFIDGVYQESDTYSIAGTALTFSEAPPVNASIETLRFEVGDIGETSANLVSIVDSGGYYTSNNVEGALQETAQSQNIVYAPAGTGAVQTTVQTKLRESVSVKDFGAVGDGVTDDTAAIQAAIDYAYTNDSPIIIDGEYRTTSTISITCPTVLALNATITKDLDNTEVIRFVGDVGGASGNFKSLIGKLTAGQSAKPTSQTSAHAFVFEDVIHGSFGHLNTGHCAYGFANDETTGFGRFWGNYIEQLTCRGCVQGYLTLPYPGSGAHTENFIGVAYFNGKELNSSTLLPKNDDPIYINNMEGLVFGTLNIEWTEISGGGAFVNIDNDSTLVINTLHFEGNELNDAVSVGIFDVSNSGSAPININIENCHFNNLVQTAGTLSFVIATTASVGTCHVNTFSGNPSSNSISDMRILDTDGAFTVDLSSRSGWERYFNQRRKGGTPPNFLSNIWFGGTPDETMNTVNNPGATVDLGYADHLRLTGTATASIATFDADAKNQERIRLITVTNSSSGSITLTGTGNLKAPQGATFDLTLATNRTALIAFNFLTSTAEIINFTA